MYSYNFTFATKPPQMPFAKHSYTPQPSSPLRPTLSSTRPPFPLSKSQHHVIQLHTSPITHPIKKQHKTIQSQKSPSINGLMMVSKSSPPSPLSPLFSSPLSSNLPSPPSPPFPQPQIFPPPQPVGIKCLLLTVWHSPLMHTSSSCSFPLPVSFGFLLCSSPDPIPACPSRSLQFLLPPFPISSDNTVQLQPQRKPLYPKLWNKAKKNKKKPRGVPKTMPNQTFAIAPKKCLFPRNALGMHATNAPQCKI